MISATKVGVCSVCSTPWDSPAPSPSHVNSSDPASTCPGVDSFCGDALDTSKQHLSVEKSLQGMQASSFGGRHFASKILLRQKCILVFHSITFLFIFPEMSGVTFSNSQHQFIFLENCPGTSPRAQSTARLETPKPSVSHPKLSCWRYGITGTSYIGGWIFSPVKSWVETGTGKGCCFKKRRLHLTWI